MSTVSVGKKQSGLKTPKADKVQNLYFGAILGLVNYRILASASLRLAAGRWHGAPNFVQHTYTFDVMLCTMKESGRV
jgi:hypothetical protein